MAGSGALLALTFALAVTTFIRIAGGVFLGAPRDRAAEEAVESPRAMVGGMQLLAIAAVVMGLLPPLGVGAAAAAASEVSHAGGVLDAVLPPVFVHPEQFPPLVKLGGTFLQFIPVNGLVVVPASAEFASIAPTYIFATLVLVIAIVAGLLRLAGVHERRQAKVWAGGVPEYRPSMQYTATAFTNPLRFIFGTVYQSARDIEGDYQQAPFFVRVGSLRPPLRGADRGLRVRAGGPRGAGLLGGGELPAGGERQSLPALSVRGLPARPLLALRHRGPATLAVAMTGSGARANAGADHASVSVQ
jgi:NADH:ubiquinone oxidoreductase subunit 5 (subunit L)/multisubunit Na+/H+ antiporter MnhA subunit